MYNKGQIMSTDFLIALILVVFSIGILLSVAELRTYEIKEEISYNILQENAEAATIVLSGGGLAGCVTDNGTIIPFSYDIPKSAALTKENLGLDDLNVYLEIDGATILADDLLGAANSMTVNLELIECSDDLGILDVSQAGTVEAILRVGR